MLFALVMLSSCRCFSDILFFRISRAFVDECAYGDPGASAAFLGYFGDFSRRMGAQPGRQLLTIPPIVDKMGEDEYRLI